MSHCETPSLLSTWTGVLGVGLRLLVALGAACGAGRAQCALQWSEYDGLSGADHEVFAVAEWDPDGPGPQPPRLVAGGRFTAIGTAVARRLAVRDPQTLQWSELGGGVDGWVHDMVSLPNGDLVVVGDFVTAGNVVVNRIARWDGTSWHAFGTGCLYPVYWVDVLLGGDIVVSGNFVQVDNVMATNIARWDGAAWHPLAGGLPGGSYHEIARFGNDLLGVSGNHVLRWDGVQWQTFAVASNSIYTFGTDGVSRVVISGLFSSVGTVACSRMAFFDGVTWRDIGGVVTAPRNTWVLSNGDVAVGTNHVLLGAQMAYGLVRWDGATWHAYGSGVNDGATSLCELSNGDLVVAGGFWSPGLRIAQWDGQAWSPVNPGCDGEIRSVLRLANGNHVIAGWYVHIGDIPARGVAMWNGSSWSAMGAGLDGEVTSLAELPNGDIVAGGNFTIIGSPTSGRVAKWDGTSWTLLGGSAPDRRVNALAVLGNDLYVAGDFSNIGTLAASRVARWDGTSWQALGGVIDAEVRTMLARPGGELIIGGDFTWIGGTLARRVARWNGTSWSQVGAGFHGSSLEYLGELPNGDILASGWLTHAFPTVVNNIARWDGVAWRAMGAGVDAPVGSSLVTPNGDLIVGGRFRHSGATAMSRLARWDGANWRALAAIDDGRVHAMAPHAQGILVGGSFHVAGGIATGPLARLDVPCPAGSVAVGGGCSAGPGPLTLSADNAPWAGETLRTTVTNVPANALAIAVFGFQQVSIPLVSLTPLGLPGCTVLTSADITYLRLPVSGLATAALPVPADPAIVGVQARHQFLTLEVNVAGALVAAATSNGLDLTFGTY